MRCVLSVGKFTANAACRSRHLSRPSHSRIFTVQCEVRKTHRQFFADGKYGLSSPRKFGTGAKWICASMRFSLFALALARTGRRLRNIGGAGWRELTITNTLSASTAAYGGEVHDPLPPPGTRPLVGHQSEDFPRSCCRQDQATRAISDSCSGLRSSSRGGRCPM